MMNLFRVLGDMTHLLCSVFLLLKIRTMKSCAGTYFVLAQLPLLSLFSFAFPSQCGLTLLFLYGAYLVSINATVGRCLQSLTLLALQFGLKIIFLLIVLNAHFLFSNFLPEF